MNTDTNKAAHAKMCARCREMVGLGEFYKRKDRTDGLSNLCKSCEKSDRAVYHIRNREKILAQKVARRIAGGELGRQARNESDRLAHRSDPERYRERWRLYARERRARCAVAKLRDRISRRLRACLANGKGGHSSELILGYTILELRAHLERQFIKGMSWENMSEWHIDHIIPLASFERVAETDSEEFRRAWALPNLRPLWAADNMRKSAKRETLL